MSEMEVDILLVEDDAADVELTLPTLRQGRLANSVHVVKDGEEALDFLFCRGAYSKRSFDRPPRLILLDLKLPKVDGIEVLRQIKADERTKPIPAVILTSSKEEKDMVNGYRLGVNSYIHKPIDFGQFLSVIKNVRLYWLLVNEPPPASVFRGAKDDG